jgi:hypothetical protein
MATERPNKRLFDPNDFCPLTLNNSFNLCRKHFECALLLSMIFVAIIHPANPADDVAKAAFSVVGWDASAGH